MKRHIKQIGIYLLALCVGVLFTQCEKDRLLTKTDDQNTDAPNTYTAGFSVSRGMTVYFSPGNLQWSATGTHAISGGGTASGTWRFAEHQWDIIGEDNQNISSSYRGWIDLFGWGTSGYNSKYPYMTSTNYL